MAAALRTTNTQMKISPSRDSALALVKIFWMSLPSRTPSVFRNVRKTIINTPTSCCTERLIAYFEDSAIGGTIQVVGEIDGNNTPRYRANPTATTVTVTVWITRNNIQPYRMPQIREYPS